MKYFLIFLIFVISGCAGKTVYETHVTSDKIFELQKCDYKRNWVVGVSETYISSKSAELVFSKDSFQDTLTSYAKKIDCFRVIDAKNISDVLDRHLIEKSEFGTNEGRGKVAKLLKADYYLTGKIINLIDEIIYPNSTFSKSKVEKVTVDVSISLKNSFTNEVLLDVESKGVIEKTVSYSSGFGAGGTADRELAQKALQAAVMEGMGKMVEKIQEEFK